MNEHLLVIYPHPDDEAFGTSGTMISAVNQGIPVTYICLTLGEMGRNMGDPLFANRETLSEIRRKELIQACKEIGKVDLRMWGYRDKTIEFEDQEALVRRIKDAIEEIKPTRLITFYPGYSVHPDHDACGAAVIEAVEMIPEAQRPVVHCVAFTKNCIEELGQQDVITDVSKYVEQKLKVIGSHASQFNVMAKRAQEDKEIRDNLTRERFWTYQRKS